VTDLIYLAAPVDTCDRETSQLIDTVRSGLVSYVGNLIYLPHRAFQSEGAEPDARLQEINLAALRRADLVVALAPVGCSSMGVPLEIQEASQAGIPVALYRERSSWALAGYPGVHQFKRLQLLLQAVPKLLANSPRKRPVSFDDVPDSVELTTEGRCPQYKVAGPGTVPVRHHSDDAGFDLYVHLESEPSFVGILPGQAVRVPCGVAVEPPAGWWSWIVGRSSTFERGLLVNQGIIDPGFRGELFAVVRNVSDHVVRVNHGERLAQLIPIPLFPPDGIIQRAEQLSESARGTNGFGSSGQ